MNENEEGRMSRLNRARRLGTLAKAAAGSTAARVKLISSFRKKLSEHWLLLSAAVLFDIFALIPVVSIAGNALFGIILWMYFGSRKKTGKGIMRSELMKIGVPVAGLSIVDFFMGILPANVASATIRIALS